MRILSVKFLNLNSLKGNHEIRFDRPPFTESGLFAITGPTGAGKTTILDAITVALYGRVHRHDKNVEEIMSRHTGECFSEVEFEVKEIAYRARWSLRRSRGKADGAMQSEKMELAEVATGKLIGGHTSTSTRQLIVEVCGLDYSQFLRSVILSQGDFTRFLKANDNERSDLLEKITDTAVYSAISSFVYNRQKREKDTLDALTGKLQDTITLTEEERNSHNERLIELQKEEKIRKAQQTETTIQLNWLLNLDKLRDRQQQLAAELMGKEQQFLESLPDFERLKQHQQAVHFKPQLMEIKTIQEQADKLQRDLDLMAERLPSFRTDAATALQHFNEADINEKKSQKNLTEAEPLLQKITTMDADLQHLKRQSEKYDSLRKQSQDNVNALTAEQQTKLKRTKELEEQLKNKEAWLTANEADRELEKQLVLLRQYHLQLVDLNTSITRSSAEELKYQQLEKTERQLLEDNKTQTQRYNKALEESEQLLGQLSDQLASALKGKTLEMLEDELNLLPGQIGNYEQQYRLSRNHQTNKDDQQALLETIEGLKNKSGQLAITLDDLKKKQEAAEKQLADLRQLVELQQRIKKYEEDRDQLQPEQPCPLCGSIHHPYVADDYHPGINESEQKRDKQEILVKSVIEQVKQEELQLNTLTINLINKEKELGNLVSVQSDIKREFGLLSNIQNESVPFNTSSPVVIDIDNPAAIDTIILQKKKYQQEMQSNLNQIRSISKKITAAQDTHSTTREGLIKMQGLTGAINERIAMYAADAKRVAEAIANTRKNHAVLSSEIMALLDPYGIIFEADQYIQIEETLKQRAKAYGKSLKDIQQFALDQATLTTELASIGELLKLHTKDLSTHEDDFRQEQDKYRHLSMERADLFGDKDPAEERARYQRELKQSGESKDKAQQVLQLKKQQVETTEFRIAEGHKERQYLVVKLAHLNDKLIHQLKDKGIVDTATLSVLFLTEDAEQRITKLQKELDTAISTLKELTVNNNKELDKEIEKNLTTETAEDLNTKQQSIDQSISGLNQEIGRLTRIFEEDNRTREKFAELARQTALQKNEHGRWNRLSALIGSENGKKFSRFAQGLTLSRLTDLANLHLQKLSDRYHILKSRESDLELLIIDGYQADVIRPMASLSGGESFLVSLALALGLSDLASHKVQINSLFIDEGFGTLDADTLDIAISALENLQAKGKTIGVISHVEALKERIGTQIQLSKQSGGISRIRILSYGNEV